LLVDLQMSAAQQQLSIEVANESIHLQQGLYNITYPWQSLFYRSFIYFFVLTKHNVGVSFDT
jgi:hypothetical protein